MYQGIEVKYLGPTNTRGSRWKASTASGISKVSNQDYALSPEDNATQAARALALQLGWDGIWYGGTTSRGYVFVATTRKPHQDMPQGAAFAIG